MKFYKVLLLFFITLFAFKSLKADGYSGGEIRWECLSNGRYVFFMNIYHDCSDPSIFSFTDRSLTIVGDSLPRNENNSLINQIVLRPDSNTWLNNRRGDISPECSTGGASLSCQDGDPGSMQIYIWQSSPIILRGRPPVDGWKFTYFNCCRTAVDNIIGRERFLLKATMYPNKQGSNIDTCYDSAPDFLDTPLPFFCRSQENDFIVNYFDKEGDSIVFNWDTIYDGLNITQPSSILYQAGYSLNNPLPDNTFDVRNRNITLDSKTGKIKFAVYNGSGLNRFQTAVRVDSYREGTKIASITRELPFYITDCSLLPGVKLNRKPIVVIGGDTTDDKVIEARAGELIEVGVQIFDFDSTTGLTGQQKIVLQPSGYMMSRDLQDIRFCRYNGPGTCAYFFNQAPRFNPNTNPPRFELSDSRTLSTNFGWQTSCDQVDINDPSNPGTNQTDYVFVLKTFDDHCPIPGITYPTLTINLKDPLPLDEPIVKGVSVGLDGRLTYSWVPPIDSADAFIEYFPQVSRVTNGNRPVNYTSFTTTRVRNYLQERRNEQYRIFNTNPGNLNDWNILSPIPGQDYYVRMGTKSGCSSGFTSNYSEPARVIELTATPSGNTAIEPLRSKITLEWNKAKEDNAATQPYFIYESPTTYYIWTNELIDSVGNGVDIESNWNVLRSSTSNSIEVPSSRCENYVAYRIEARDTVITYAQGNGFNLDSTITLTYSTFSTVDTLYTVLGESRVYQDNLDSIYTDNVYDSVQWINCDSNAILSNASNFYFIPSEAGSYGAIVTLDNCLDSSNCVIIAPLDTSVTSISYLELRSNESNARYQWIDCRADTIIPGATSKNFLPQDSGYYAVVVSKYAMKDTSSCFAMLSISLSEVTLTEKLNLYPNPNNGWLNIESSAKEELNLRIFNIQGQLVQEEVLVNANNQIQIKGENGLYFITITNQKGEQANFKVVKQ